MKSPIKNYMFWLKILGAAVLCALGLWVLFDKEVGKKLVVITTGVAFFVFALIRIIPLIRRKQGKFYNILNLSEIGIDIVLSILLIIAGITIEKDGSDSNAFTKFIDDKYRYIAGSMFYLRGVVHMICTNFLNEKQSPFKLGLNIAFITIGTICFSVDFSSRRLSIFIAIIALAAFAYLSYDGYVDFNNFNKSRKEKDDTKDKAKDVEKTDDATKPAPEIGEVPNAIIEEKKEQDQIVS